MNTTEVFRPVSGLWITGVVAAAAAFGLVSVATSGQPADLLRYGPVLVLVAAVVWAMFWRPSVTVSDAGVSLRNVLRTVDLPWPSIVRIDTKYALTLETAYGTYTAWAAPSSGRRHVDQTVPGDLRGLPESTYGAGASVRPGDLPASASGQAAALVRRRWDALRDAGHLDNPRLERQRAAVRWHWPVVALLGGLAAAAAAGLLLTHA
ncbi:MAG TPA: PH domain-containing protein [Propionicimonas sp.]